ncbi:lipoprotein-releasing ABC transporter ATP-binding protein LolD [Alteromonas sp. ASW11-130]|uniref:lipoprotein-releasing ABC transporter ATP-binding protein LolD n=1 Tax=Alteromonas sp. ASW11-130 TaxID=3015775 RepID=UPI002241DBFC|nr:lipoprotein-releasing ABC transporter ATP-binding protein LolD [Alteromonas sp. ASW11-130]MCW8091988.1 lipoprotein-releasing ABC transporter ATP-binding protein LolD [Alteromonas sp. ASW11-130]
MEDLLVCQDISKTYHDGENDTAVLSNVSFSVSTGEHIAILGSSGSGKSTLLHIMGGLDTPSNGRVLFDGKAIDSLKSKELNQIRNQQMGFIYQFHHLLGEFSALENVAMPLLIGGSSRRKANSAAKHMLELVGLAHRLEHKPAALSGGERQRVAIARALVSQPKLVMADEPTGNLDHKTGLSVYSLLKDISRKLNTTFIVVTHDRELANKMDRVLTLQDGHLQAVEKTPS